MELLDNHMTIRRLAAVLIADITGYSRLMHEDEDGTHARVSRIMREVAGPAIGSYDGRIVKGTGDGFLAEFPSAVGAARAAVAFQTAVAGLVAQDPPERRIVFHQGIHLGEIIIEPGDIFGDGVNIAARLCGLAGPGEIMVSGAVHENLLGRIACDFEDRGASTLKNIARPVHAFRLIPTEATNTAPAPAPPTPAGPAEKPSIVVLPFKSLSADPEQDFLADGMVEDITTALSRFHSLFVIARNSAFTYKGKVIDLHQVGRELNVRYVLEGSVRRGGNRVRITSQLIQIDNLAHIWADRYDCDYEDIFDAQDKITAAVAAAIEPAVGAAEHQRARRKPPESLDAWESYHRGLWHHAQTNAAENTEAQVLFRHAIELDPKFSPAFQGLVFAIMDDAVLYLQRPIAEALALAEPLARKAVLLDATDSGAYVALNYISFARGDLQAALAGVEQALALNPNSAGAYWSKTGSLVYLGRYEESAVAAQTYLRLSPRDLRSWRVLNHLAVGRYLLGDYPGAVDAAGQALRAHPDQPLSFRWLAAALGQLGRAEEALTVIAQASAALTPVTFDDYALARGNWLAPEAHELLLQGLRKAGWSPAYATSR